MGRSLTIAASAMACAVLGPVPGALADHYRSNGAVRSYGTLTTHAGGPTTPIPAASCGR